MRAARSTAHLVLAVRYSSTEQAIFARAEDIRLADIVGDWCRGGEQAILAEDTWATCRQLSVAPEMDRLHVRLIAVLSRSAMPPSSGGAATIQVPLLGSLGAPRKI